MKICPTCNKEFPDDQKFCKYDGTPLAEKKAETEAGKKCPKCGRTYPTDAGFCMTCGAKLVALDEKNVCASCGAELPEGAAFCMKCGAKAGKKVEEELLSQQTTSKTSTVKIAESDLLAYTIQELTEIEKQNHDPTIQYYFGEINYNGKSEYWLKKADDQVFPERTFFSDLENLTDDDFEKGQILIDKFVSFNSPISLTLAAIFAFLMHKANIVIRYSPKELAQKASCTGSVNAKFLLAYMNFEQPENVLLEAIKNNSEDAKYHPYWESERCSTTALEMAAKLGSPVAQYRLATMMLESDTAEDNEKKALQYMFESARGKFYEAQEWVCLAYTGCATLEGLSTILCDSQRYAYWKERAERDQLYLKKRHLYIYDLTAELVTHLIEGM